MAGAAISLLLVRAHPFFVGHDRRRMNGRGNGSHQTKDDDATTYLTQSLHLRSLLTVYRGMKLAILRPSPQPRVLLEFQGGAEGPLWVISGYWWGVTGTSALPPEADMLRGGINLR